MRSLISLATPFVLALVLAVGSVGFAASHQTGSGVDKYVICTGYGLVTITVDAEGNRVADGVPCPDSIALSGALLVLAPDLAFARIEIARVVGGQAESVFHNQTSDAWRDARAPPHPFFRLI